MYSLKKLLLEEEDNKVSELAIFVDAGRHSSDYIIYRPKYYAQRLKVEILKAKEQFDSIRFKGSKFDNFKDFYTFSNVQDIFTDPKGVFGFATINNGRVIGLRGSCNRANELRSASAKEGFGTLLFNVVLASESPIMSNRMSPSEEEYRHLQFFQGNSKIEDDSFEDEMGLHKKTSSDCNKLGDSVLDSSYKTLNDESFQLTPLVNSHKHFLYQMKNYFDKIGVDFILSRVKEYIADAGYYFHLEERGAPGWYESYDDIKE